MEPAILGRKPMKMRIDYGGVAFVMTMAIGPFKHPKPRKHFAYSCHSLQCSFESMPLGLSSSSDLAPSEHYISGWR